MAIRIIVLHFTHTVEDIAKNDAFQKKMLVSYKGMAYLKNDRGKRKYNAVTESLICYNKLLWLYSLFLWSTELIHPHMSRLLVANRVAAITLVKSWRIWV